jgi:uncharacterized membrane protein YqjE
MDTAKRRSGGFLGSFRTLGDHLLATVQDRLELFSIELEEEKLRLVQTFVWISAAVFSAMMAITFTSLVLVYLFWASARLAVLGGLAVVYIGATVAIIVGFRRFLARQPRPFQALRLEIGEDRECIREES